METSRVILKIRQRAPVLYVTFFYSSSTTASMHICLWTFCKTC